MSFEEFVQGLRDPLTPRRLALVKRAFRVVDKDGSGVLDPSDIAGCYDASKHPGVVAGTLTEEEAAMAFLAPWAADGDARIEATELYERYEGISPLYDDDDAFDAMMRAVWHLE